MRSEEVTLVEIDWNQISSIGEFFDTALPQCQSPAWHGRNLNALQDSWVTGDINPKGPPYHFRFKRNPKQNEEMDRIRETVEKIARESVEENGGIFETS
ncbi:MAG: barstar family protein [Verrucomicrobiota bacterium]